MTGTNTGTFAKIDAPAEDDASQVAHYIGGKRYVRPVINVTGAHSNGTPIAITAIQTHAKYPPV